MLHDGTDGSVPVSLAFEGLSSYTGHTVARAQASNPDEGGGSAIGGIIAAGLLVLIVGSALVAAFRSVRRSRDRT